MAEASEGEVILTKKTWNDAGIGNGIYVAKDGEMALNF